MTWNAAPSLQWHTSHLRKPSYNPQPFKMSAATGVGAACSPQSLGKQHKTHRGLPVEMLREIVLFTFGSYFPEICANPDFNTSWDPILSFMHTSRLLRDVAISILGYTLGDVCIDPQTKFVVLCPFCEREASSLKPRIAYSVALEKIISDNPILLST